MYSTLATAATNRILTWSPDRREKKRKIRNEVRKGSKRSEEAEESDT